MSIISIQIQSILNSAASYVPESYDDIKKTAAVAGKIFMVTAFASTACFLNPAFFITGLFYGGLAYDLANKNIQTVSLIKDGIKERLNFACLAGLIAAIAINAFFALAIVTAAFSVCYGTWLGNHAFYFATNQTPPEFYP